MAPIIGAGLALGGMSMLSSLLGGLFQKKDNSMDDYIAWMNRRTKMAGKMIDQYSGQNIADVKQDWASHISNGEQDLVSRGLTNSTIKPTMENAWMRGEEADLNRARDAMLDRKLQAYLGTTGQTGAGIAGWPPARPMNYGSIGQSAMPLGMMLAGSGLFGGGSPTYNINNAGVWGGDTDPTHGGTMGITQIGEPPPESREQSMAPPPAKPWAAWSNYKVAV